MPEPPSHAPATAPHGLTCITCAYDLATLPTTNPCPECGTPIERSFFGPLFRFADADTRRTIDRASYLLRASMGVVLWAFISSLAGFVLFLIFAILLALVLPDFVIDESVVWGVGVGASVFLGAGLVATGGLYAAGAYLLTGPAPLGPLAHGSWAWAARWSMVALLALGPLAFAAGPALPTHPLAAHAVGTIASALIIVHYVTIRLTLSRLARRCAPPPDIRAAGPGAWVAAFFLAINEYTAGWFTLIPLVVAFCLYLGLEPDIRRIRSAIRDELAASIADRSEVSSP